VTRHDAAIAAAIAAAPPVDAEQARAVRALLLPYAIAAQPHRCHLEQRTADQRAVCRCGWVGDWYITGARAVEQGTTHIIKSQGGKPE
jgi:hypothetical protein